jgi:hypothetical protein
MITVWHCEEDKTNARNMVEKSKCGAHTSEWHGVASWGTLHGLLVFLARSLPRRRYDQKYNSPSKRTTIKHGIPPRKSTSCLVYNSIDLFFQCLLSEVFVLCKQFTPPSFIPKHRLSSSPFSVFSGRRYRARMSTKSPHSIASTEVEASQSFTGNTTRLVLLLSLYQYNVTLDSY